MKRFFGMMPSDEVEIEKVFKETPNSVFRHTIQAGPNGWSIICSDGSASFNDESIGTEENFKNALECLMEHYPNAVEFGIMKSYEDKENKTMADLFKIAAKKKYRFNYRGVISVEDLWDLNVEALDSIYKNLKKQQKTSQEESLLETVSKEDKEINNKIEIIKTIVNDKLAAKEKAIKAAEKRTQNQKILEIMADKKDAALKEKSIEELQAMLVTDDTDDIDED